MKISTILFFCLLMTACMQTKSFHRINGWYYVNKSPIWREATKKSIGKRIAFVFNDTVITAPLINIPLESGHFQISNPHGYDLERIFRELQKEIDISRFGN